MVQISIPNCLILGLISQAVVYKRVRFKCVLRYLCLPMCRLIGSFQATKFPPWEPPFPPPLLPRSERPFRQSHSVAKVNFLPLNTSKFKDIALVYRQKDLKRAAQISLLSQPRFKFPTPRVWTTV